MDNVLRKGNDLNQIKMKKEDLVNYLESNCWSTKVKLENN